MQSQNLIEAFVNCRRISRLYPRRPRKLESKQVVVRLVREEGMKVLLKTTSLIDLCLHNLISQESEHDVFKEQITAATKENLDKAFILLKNFLEHAHEFDAVNDSLPLS